MASGSSEQPRERLSFGERRAVILGAAGEVFAADGFDHASMRGIARASAITTPVLYDHFRSKIDLYLAVVRQHAENLVASWSNHPETSSAEELFKQTATTFFSWIRRNENSWRILFLDNPRDPEAVQAHRQVRNLATEAMTGLVERLPSGGSGPVDRARVNRAIAAQLTGAGNALVTWWWDNRDISTEAVVQLNHDLMWHGLSRVQEPLQR